MRQDTLHNWGKSYGDAYQILFRWSNQGEMDRACGTHWGEKMNTDVWSGILNETDSLEDYDINGG